jgi:hypothetical protein
MPFIAHGLHGFSCATADTPIPPMIKNKAAVIPKIVFTIKPPKLNYSDYLTA